ncbi:MAG: hypothetical protein KF708_04140 [Pirellulales bacterium]|nr:hypothetical protein [Pirellulales bacterium]
MTLLTLACVAWHQPAQAQEVATAPVATEIDSIATGPLEPILVFTTQSLEKFVEDVKYIGTQGDDDEFIDSFEILLGEILAQRDKLLGPLAGPGVPAAAEEPAVEEPAVEEPAAEAAATENAEQAPAEEKPAGAAAQGNAKPKKKVNRFSLRDMPGVDQTRPWGFVVLTDGVAISPVAFVPIVENGLGDLMESFKIVFQEWKLQDDGSYIVGKGTLTGVVREVNGWAFIAQTADHLVNPPDPLALVGDLPSRYDMAAQWNVQNVPEVLRSLLIDHSGALLGEFLKPRPGESDAQYALRHEMAHGGVQFFRRALAEVERVTWGVKIDQETSRLVSETLVEPLADSPLKSQFEGLSSVETRFGGIVGVKDPVLAVNLTGPLDEGMMSHMRAELAAYEGALNELVNSSAIVSSDEERTAYKDLATQLLEQGKATVEGGKLDLALTITKSGRTMTLVAGAAVADSSALEKVFEQMIEMAKNDPNVLEAKLGVDEHETTKIHKLVVKPTDELKPFDKLFGGLAIHVAFNDGAAWMAIGPEALPNLKAAISGAPVSVKPLQVTAHLQPLTRMMGETVQDSTQKLAFSMLGMNLSHKGADSDLMTITAAPTDEGNLRLDSTIGRGAFKTLTLLTPLIGQMIRGGGPGTGGAPF